VERRGFLGRLAGLAFVGRAARLLDDGFHGLLDRRAARNAAAMKDVERALKAAYPVGSFAALMEEEAPFRKALRRGGGR
jgi:hypothetical protein